MHPSQVCDLGGRLVRLVVALALEVEKEVARRALLALSAVHHPLTQAESDKEDVGAGPPVGIGGCEASRQPCHARSEVMLS